MIIQCPNCQEECLAPDASISDPVRPIQCGHCGLAFTVRPHDSGSVQGNHPTQTPDLPEDLVTSDTTPRPPDPAPTAVRPIPFWMVQIHETPPEAPVPSPPEDEQGPFTQPHDPGDREADGGDVPLIVDDTLHEGPLSLREDPVAPPSVVAARRQAGQGARAGQDRIRRVLPAALVGVGLCVLLVLTVLVGPRAVEQIGNWAGSLRALLPFERAGEGTLNFSEHRSEFIARGPGTAPLFVIEGTVTNNHPRPCHSIRVRGILFDERGKPSNEETAYCGNILTRKELVGEPEEAIRKRLQNPMGSSLSNFNIQPGKSIPFMLVFFNPPEKPSEFSIEIADYSLQEASSD